MYLGGRCRAQGGGTERQIAWLALCVKWATGHCGAEKRKNGPFIGQEGYLETIHVCVFVRERREQLMFSELVTNAMSTRGLFLAELFLFCVCKHLSQTPIGCGRVVSAGGPTDTTLTIGCGLNRIVEFGAFPHIICFY